MPDDHHRHSIRLPEYDYSHSGAYFVTTVIHNRHNILGEIRDDVVQLTDAGRIVQQMWMKLPYHYPCMESIAFVIMPNHVHGIIGIKDISGSRVPVTEIIGAFKSYSARRINLCRNTSGVPVWQRNYYEHVIRNNQELERLHAYIVDNPRRWAEDAENHDHRTQ